MNKIWTIGALLQWTQQYFAGKGIDSPRLDAEILLAHVLHKERIYLYAHYDEPLNGEELAAYRAMVKKRADRLSVAHILGTKAFMGLDFKVSEDVLIPRPETEMLVETVVTAAEGTAPVIIDIGTGSGAIVLSLLHYLPQATGTGVDISTKALAIATGNGRSLGLDDRVTWIESDLFTQVPPGTCDWLVSNPPYLTQGDMEQLQPEVRHDPALALYGGDDGLDFYRRIAADSPAYVKVGGHCAVEIGAGQADDVTAIFCTGGAYEHDQTVKDYGGIDRVLVFSRKG
ncbi:peptide chain release factor N(5)-glutamine methyltransferase [Megasphaera elsdenii]|uniref:Release factor glutamine methyltransferase n=1 Tax=Megasphaera elsdenii DSM 20460 TaxID=1064535 RepID=G0VML9_MEGEL|nr:peptide chain release factor N(5)-glutamine methyltransferase [Megasphaera elsdenii]AVO74908.1 peptide chain release factor N(5)-glutamine methyltransferase [Megasphaera elsdenii DSM 20460]CCC74411.1 protein-(Glutamine-N5) methyltransferase [Megasphaera elsdenii DSM 20460]